MDSSSLSHRRTNLGAGVIYMDPAEGSWMNGSIDVTGDAAMPTGVRTPVVRGGGGVGMRERGLPRRHLGTPRPAP